MCGEFIGTFLFLFFAFSGTQVANTQTQPQTSTTIAQASNPAQLLYISLCFGFSLAVNAWVFFRISGGLFNPAVTLGMCLVGALPYIRGVLLTVSQILGAISAAAVVSVLFPGPLDVRTALRIGTSVTQGLFIEMFLTAQLVFTIFMLAAEKHKATFIAPVGIGLSLFIAELTGLVPITNLIFIHAYCFRCLLHRRVRKPSSILCPRGSLTYIPPLSLGKPTMAPQLTISTNPLSTQIYWVGPILGSLLASGFYRFMKMLEYETANPGADFDEHEYENFDPEIHTSRPQTIVKVQASGDPLEPHSAAEADHDDPDKDVKVGPDSQAAGKPRHRRTSAVKGGRKERGFSPAKAVQKDSEEGIDVYDAGSSAEMGKASNRAQT